MAGAFASGLLLIGAALFWPAGEAPSRDKASPFGEPESRLPAGGEESDPDAAPEPLLAVVVGELGYDPVRDAEWLDFPEKITLAVLPFGPSSRNIASYAQARGHCVILHVPMEPRNETPDRTEPFRLRVGMDREEIGERVARMAQDVPQAVGAMNHMGSAFTTDAASMNAFAAALKERGFFFVDGATASGSLGLEASERAGVTSIRRDFFLDNDPDPEAMRRRWEDAAARARETGGALLVCRSRRETRDALLELLPGLRKEGIRTATVTELIERRLSGTRAAGE
jgi:polysaccharide deacetylase 2 family uncharacterized protein YibQ